MRALALLTSLLLPVAAGAEPSLSLRLGWAQSFGSAAEGMPMSDLAGAQVPVQADALWRFGRPGAGEARGLAAGAYASWGPGLVVRCDPGASCSAWSLRLGLQATWTFHPSFSSFDAWAGAGWGWEWTKRRRAYGGNEVAWTYGGMEVVSLQGGADVLRRGRATFGPFLLVAIGRYSTLGLDTPVETGDGEIAGKRIHSWAEVGVRAKFDL